MVATLIFPSETRATNEHTTFYLNTLDDKIKKIKENWKTPLIKRNGLIARID